jgi:hypothetical protein
VVFGRVPEHEGTIMRRLGDLPHFKETLERKGIDELFSTGWLARRRKWRLFLGMGRRETPPV